MHYTQIIRLFLVLAMGSMIGCASKSKSVANLPKPAIGDLSISEAAPALENLNTQELKEYVQKEGVVFGKTDFQGVLKAIYVKLTLENKKDAEQKYQLYVGVPSDQESSFFDFKTVGPGYFFIKLPQGTYKISSVSIPVGSTQATEETSVEFDVLPDTISYIGTLKMTGTKERIKLGGVPVIKPGFDYTIDIKDEQKEGEEMFHKNYPEINKEIVIRLMRNSL